MGKVVSNEQRVANRQNARQSTGPKTPTGKARSPRTSRVNSTIDTCPEPRRIRRSPVPPAPSPNFAASDKCHQVTLREKSVLAK
jgi:hypothetical protein